VTERKQTVVDRQVGEKDEKTPTSETLTLQLEDNAFGGGVGQVKKHLGTD